MEAQFQDSQFYVTSKDTEVNVGLKLAGKRPKPNNAAPAIENLKNSVLKGAKQGGKKQTSQEARKKKAAVTAHEATHSHVNDKDTYCRDRIY